VLSGRRSISKAQAKRLAEFFHVPADLFIRHLFQFCQLSPALVASTVRIAAESWQTRLNTSEGYIGCLRAGNLPW
jgi:hypothetical protein